MRYAKAMYLAGEIVQANECNFNSSKDLGLVCPLCSQAVYLRSGALREQLLRNGQKKLQIINPYFAHYKTGFFDYNCDNRILTKEGRDRLEKIKIKARNQRLKLYNRHLWEMFAEDRNVKKSFARSLIKTIGKRKIQALVHPVREEIRLNTPIYYSAIVEQLQLILDKPKFESLTNSLFIVSSHPEEREKQYHYFANNCDRRVHLAVCSEILDFCTTRTAGYFLEKIIPIVVPTIGAELNVDLAQAKKRLTVSNTAQTICAQIGSTHWLEEINKRLGNSAINKSDAAKIGGDVIFH